MIGVENEEAVAQLPPYTVLMDAKGHLSCRMGAEQAYPWVCQCGDFFDHSTLWLEADKPLVIASYP